jgi:hypothetical protein
LKVVTGNGDILSQTRFAENNAGYDLRQFLLALEGNLWADCGSHHAAHATAQEPTPLCWGGWKILAAL